MSGPEHQFVGSPNDHRVIGALETCCRQGEMLRIRNRHVDWEQHQVAIPGRNTRTARTDPSLRPGRTPRADPQAPQDARPAAFVFGSPAGEFVSSFKTAWESLLLVANGHDTKRATPGARVDRAKLRQIDLALARSPSRGRLPAPARRRRHPHDSADARARRHEDDAAVPEHHGRRAAEGDDGDVGAAAAVEGRWPVVGPAVGPAKAGPYVQAKGNTPGEEGAQVKSRLYRLSVICQSASKKVARPAGLEPATLGLEGRCSIHLSYGRVRVSAIGTSALDPRHCSASHFFTIETSI